MENSKVNSTEVVISKNSNPSKAITNGIEKLGGISGIVQKGDQVFVKINLRAPYGFPANVNFDSLRTIINLCKVAEAKNVIVGGFPDNGIRTESISNILGLQSYVDNLGAEFLFLDDQNLAPLKTVELGEKTIEIPKIILETDKLIIFNQVSVDPLFKCTISLLNSYSLVPNKYQGILKITRPGKDYLFLDHYKQDLISNILDVYSIKKPSLVINDMFDFLEGAGPYVYKDSNLLHTGLVVIGRDAVAVDLITLKLFNIDLLKSDILLEARNRKLGITDESKINLIGENLENNRLEVKFSAYRLDDIIIKNTTIKAGRICSGCFKEAYHLLNCVKTHMTKDLKYIKRQYFLTGENPPEPESLDHIIVFGECAINSTKNREFRTIRTSSDKNYVETIKGKMGKESKSQKVPKVKEKTNKQVIEIPGCPPNLFESLNSILKYYGKSQAPNLSFYNNLLKSYYQQASSKKLK
ncbi:MAG: DUF362 domain-containing protein [Promethearchaeota archaeon]